jgi:hypothetical protein
MTKDDLVSKDTALKMAIEALEMYVPYYVKDRGCEAINACKKALQTNALDEMQKVTEKEYYQEPKQGIELEWYVKGWDDAKKDWQGLTDEERYLNEGRTPEEIEYAIAIEQELKTKNGFSGLKDKNA